MKKNLTKIMMLALTLCMMIAVFAVVASAAEPTTTVVALENTTVTYTGNEQVPTILVFDGSAWGTVEIDDESVKVDGEAYVEGTFTDIGVYLIDVVVGGKTYSLRYEIVKIKLKISMNGNAGTYTYNNGVHSKPWGSVSFSNVEDKYVIKSVKDQKPKAKVTYYVAEDYENDPENAQPVSLRNVGTYTVVMTVTGNDIFEDAKAVYKRAVKILPKTIDMTIEDAYKEYGKADPETYEYKVDGLIDGDDVEFGFTREEGETCYIRFGDEYKITPAIIGGADKNNYKLNYNDAYLIIKQRVLTAEDFDVETLVYNGQLQLPKVEVKKTSLGEEGCTPEIVASARKYGGTYYVTVVALTNDSYTINDAIKLEYTIVAEGEKDSDNAVKDFIDGVGNAGEAVGEVVEVVTPVFNAIGKVIADGIKALVNDFFSRVFG